MKLDLSRVEALVIMPNKISGEHKFQQFFCASNLMRQVKPNFLALVDPLNKILEAFFEKGFVEKITVLQAVFSQTLPMSPSNTKYFWTSRGHSKNIWVFRILTKTA